LVRYEDLTGERQAEEVDGLLKHSGIHLPPAELEALLSRYSFSRMRGGKDRPGAISHYRKGRPGDWREHFDDDIAGAFASATGDLVDILGYGATTGWSPDGYSRSTTTPDRQSHRRSP
jgi:hypothetical protein